jgi:hypothetical protein
MNCLFLILSLLTLVGTFAADINVYKKDFESTGKAFFSPQVINIKDIKLL